MLWQRVLTAVVGVPLVLAAVMAGEECFFLLIAAVVGLGLGEFYRLAEKKGAAPSPYILTGLGLAFPLTAYLAEDPFPLWVGFMGLAVFGEAIRAIFAKGGGSVLSASGLALLGLLYVAGGASLLILLRRASLALTLLAFLLTWANDTLAYFVGLSIGKVRLAPAISPRKTVEGMLGGILGTEAVAVTINLFWLHWPLWQIGLLGLVLAVVAQLGDLLESAFKREAGIKDSGRVLPGHGGILDRFDGLLLVSPLMYLLHQWWGAMLK